MKLVIFWSLLFLVGVYMGLNFGGDAKGKNKNYKVPTSLRYQLHRVVDNPTTGAEQTRARFETLPELEFKVSTQI